MVLPTGRDLSVPLDDLEIRVRLTRRTRLDLFLFRELGWSSRNKVQRLVALDRVTVNGRPAKASMKVGGGDVVRVRIISETSERETHVPLAPPLWEDPYLLVVAKPPGRLVHPTGRTISGTVIDELHARYRAVNDRGTRAVVPRLCHRLDRDTSGFLLIAKSVAVRRAVQEAFEADQVRKSYLAVVEGMPEAESFEVDAAITDHFDLRRAHSNRLARLDEDGRPSLTRFRVLGRGTGFAIVHCLPVTGRQNQIRVHLASTGHPILGDRGYGSDPAEAGLPPSLPRPERALLHSFGLRFRHPVWGTEREFRCPPHPDLRPFLVAAGVSAESLPPLPSLGGTPGSPRRGSEAPRCADPPGAG